MAKKKVPDIQRRFRAELARVTRESAKRQKEMDRLELQAGRLIAQANKAHDAGKDALAKRYQERAQKTIDELTALCEKRS